MSGFSFFVPAFLKLVILSRSFLFLVSSSFDFLLDGLFGSSPPLAWFC
uniref:Uncharacterized protein n=1 Tax=Anguilla anguilla TaxID=7936 RepID=A0A0E9TP97_ANGAN